MENQLTPNNSMILEIRELLENARKNVAQQVNTQLLTTYWNIGRIIVEYEQQNQIRADYGKQTLRELSKELTREFGKGFSRSNLQNMRAFYLAYEKCQTVSGKLSWSHYCELLSITDENKRSFYEKESINSGWSVRELKRQIDSSLYERLLLSSGDANKEKVLSLAQKGIEINQPADIIRDPYVFEFLGVPENKPILESDLEKALVVQQFVKEPHHQAAQQPSAASKIQKYFPKACKQRRFHAQFASFFRFMAANLSLTHCVTRARPLMWV